MHKCQIMLKTFPFLSPFKFARLVRYQIDTHPCQGIRSVKEMKKFVCKCSEDFEPERKSNLM